MSKIEVGEAKRDIEVESLEPSLYPDNVIVKQKIVPKDPGTSRSKDLTAEDQRIKIKDPKIQTQIKASTQVAMKKPSIIQPEASGKFVPSTGESRSKDLTAKKTRIIKIRQS